MSSYGTAYPTPGAGGLTDVEWRHWGAALGDGIVNDYGGGAGSSFVVLTKSTSSRVITVRLGNYRIRGMQFEPSQDTLSLTIPDCAAGQTRLDRIVVRFDAATQDITVVVKTGTATSGTPVSPSLTRVDAGVWESPLHTVLGGNAAASTLTFSDQRRWVGPHITLPSLAALYGYGTDFPNGTRLFEQNTRNDWLMTYPGGVATWVNLDNPDWTDIVLPTGTGGMSAYDATPQYRLVRGNVELRGSIKATSGNLTPTGGGSGVLLFTLPASARPDDKRRLPTAPYGYVLINTAGQVTFADRNANAFVNLDGIRFPAAS